MILLLLMGGLWFCLSAAVLSAAEKPPPLSIVVEGLSGEALQNVKAALVLPSDLVENGKIDKALVEHFEEQVPRKVREALQPFGYYRAEVRVVRDYTEDGSDLLVVHVSLGEPIRLGDVKVNVAGAGAGESLLQRFVSDFPLRRGDVLRQDLYERQKSALLKKALDLGYLGATFPHHAIRISVERSTADIDLLLETGPQYHFGEVSFIGQPSYPASFLRRYLEFKPGDAFSYEQLAKTQANYASADRFREIAVNAVRERAVGDRIPVEIALAPSPPKTVKLGAGYGTDTGPRATVRYRDVHVARLGQELEVELKLSFVLQGLSTRYLFPGSTYRDYTALSAGWQREDTGTILSKSVKVEVERVRGFSGGRTGSIFLQARQENSDAGSESTNTFLLMPGARYSHLAYDNIIRPRKGYHYQTELRATHQDLGSSTGFIQCVTSAGAIIPLPWEFAFLARAAAGGTWQNGPAQDLPVSVRFFAGGDRSVRGYAYQGLGPRDSQGNVLGGQNLLTGSAELEHYFRKNWGVAVFYDVGNAFNNLSDIAPAVGAGLGIRYYSPIGPIKLDVARQMNAAEADIRIHLTIGVGI